MKRRTTLATTNCMSAKSPETFDSGFDIGLARGATGTGETATKMMTMNLGLGGATLATT